MPENTKKSKTAKQSKASEPEPVNTKKAAPAKPTPKKQKAGAKTDAPKKKVRYFKIIDPKTGATYGRYVGDTPKQAAGKAYSKTIQKLKKEGKKVKNISTIYLRESSRGSSRKIYAYEAKRKKLDDPQVLTFVSKDTGEQKVITYKYRNDIRKIKVPETFAALTVRKPVGSKSAKKPAKKTGSKTAKTTKSSSKNTKPAKAPAKKTAPKANKSN